MNTQHPDRPARPLPFALPRQPCPDCAGRGCQPCPFPDVLGLTLERCPACGGTGQAPRRPSAMNHPRRCVRCLTCPVCGPFPEPQEPLYLAVVGSDPVWWADTLEAVLAAVADLREPGLEEDVVVWRGPLVVCVLPHDGPPVYPRGPHLAG